jgi:hypothetical protein
MGSSRDMLGVLDQRFRVDTAWTGAPINMAGVGLRTKDWYGNHHLSPNGTATYTYVANSTTTGVPSMLFYGDANCYFKYPTIADIAPQTGGLSWNSWGIWFRVDDFVNWSNIITFGTTLKAWDIYVHRTSFCVALDWWDASNTAHALTSSNTISAGPWNFVGFEGYRINATTYRWALFLNGVYTVLGSDPVGTRTPTGEFWLGQADTNSGSTGLRGNIGAGYFAQWDTADTLVDFYEYTKNFYQ